MFDLSNYLPKVYLFLVDDRIEHKQELTKTGVNKNIVATPNYNEYKDVLQNIKCLGPKYRSIKSKVEIKEQEAIKPTNFLCDAFIIKYVS